MLSFGSQTRVTFNKHFFNEHRSFLSDWTASVVLMVLQSVGLRYTIYTIVFTPFI